MDETMVAARLHAPGEPFRIEQVPVPSPRHGEVLVRVAAAGLIPNMRAVVSGEHWYRLPPLPAVYGLDAAGTVERLGPGVVGFAPGDRVYVNPILGCGACPGCRNNKPMQCQSFALRGYFSTGPAGDDLQRAFPCGAFAQFTTAAVHSLVRLPEAVTFEQAARFGYLGTAYHALREVGAGPGGTVIVNGVTGTLGVACTVLALAMGAAKVLGTGRNAEVMVAVERLAPRRVVATDVRRPDLAAWVRDQTGGFGAEAMVDCQGRGADVGQVEAALKGLCKGGKATVIGAVEGAARLDYGWLLGNCVSVSGSNWFTTAEGQQMADMAGCGALDLSVWETRAFPLDGINEGMDFVANRQGGLVNAVVSMTPSGDVSMTQSVPVSMTPSASVGTAP